MLNIVKNILAWADKEPIPFEEFRSFFKENERSLLFQINQRGFEVESIYQIMNPYPDEIAPRMDELTDILMSVTDSLEYHPGVVECAASSLRLQAIVKKHNLFDFLYERYLAVPPREKIYNPQAGGVARGLVNALVKHFTWDKFDKIQALIRNESLGECRLLLLRAFSKPTIFRKEEVQRLLLEIAEHPPFVYEAKKLLKRNDRKPR